MINFSGWAESYKALALIFDIVPEYLLVIFIKNGHFKSPF